MDDYYELVGVERTASRDDIDRKIREQLRLWQRRTSNADLDRRQAAERRVQQLGQARTTLLDEEKRRHYDRQLTALRASEPPPLPATGATMAGGTAAGGTTAGGTTTGGTTTGGRTDATGSAVEPAGGWLNQARGFLAANDPQSAAYAARESLRSTPNPPSETWTILARANAELGRLDDALFEARRATTTDPGSAQAQLALGRVHEQRQEWSEAQRAYEAAGRLDPQSEAAHLGTARSLARSGRAGTAMVQLERRFAQAPDRTKARDVLARGLVDAAGAAMRAPGANRMASLAEQGVVRRMLQRARDVADDREILRVVSQLEAELARVRRGAGPAASGARSRAATYGPAGAGARTNQPPTSRTNVLAIVSLVLALAGLVTCLTAPIGAVLGHMARNQIRERGERGDGVALAAVIVGWLLTVVICCGGFAIYASG